MRAARRSARLSAQSMATYLTEEEKVSPPISRSVARCFCANPPGTVIGRRRAGRQRRSAEATRREATALFEGMHKAHRKLAALQIRVAGRNMPVPGAS